MSKKERFQPLSGNDMPRFGGPATFMRLPAVDLDAGAGDHGGVVRGQEQHHVGDVLGLAQPTDRYVLLGLGPLGRVGHGRCARHHVGLDEAGVDRVHPDAVGAEFLGRDLGHAPDRPLGGAVGAGAEEHDMAERGLAGEAARQVPRLAEEGHEEDEDTDVDEVVRHHQREHDRRGEAGEADEKRGAQHRATSSATSYSSPSTCASSVPRGSRWRRRRRRGT